MAWDSSRTASIYMTTPRRRRRRSRRLPQSVMVVPRRAAVVTSVRVGATTVFTAVSALVASAAGAVHYHWYIDGAPVQSGQTDTLTVVLAAGEQATVDVIDTRDPNFDALAHAPAGWPARRTLYWNRTLDTTIERYRVEQQKSGGAWEVLGAVTPSRQQWSFTFLTEPLDDLTTYAWRIVQVDIRGNDADTLELGTERIVRRPDAPDFTATFDPVTTKVTLDAA